MRIETGTPRILNGLALALVLAALVLAPIPLGSDTQWAQSAAFLLAAAAAAIWLASGLIAGSLAVIRSGAMVFLGAFFALGLLELVPLPVGILRVLSPNAVAMRAQALGPESVAGNLPISLNPFATEAALFRYGTCALIFVLLGSLVRTKRALMWAVAVLLAGGLFQVIYTLAERAFASGGRYVFWVQKTVYHDVFTGTFFNRNHFAGYIEMLLPLAVALVVTVRRARAVRDRDLSLLKFVQVVGAPETQKKLVLTVPAVLLAVGVALSLSRSAVVVSIVALSLLAVLVLVSEPGHAFRLLGALLIALTGLVLVVAAGPILAKFESTFSGRMISVYARLDLLESAWNLIRDFPLTGTGLGTLASVFGPYQSANLGNVSVNYLANDWAQIACEGGIPMLLVVIGGLAVFVGATARAAMRRHDRYCKWVALGCLMGGVAMMLHSFTDFNLTRTTSNAMLFAAVLALAYAAAHADHEESEGATAAGQVELPFGPPLLRLVLSAVFIAPIVLLSCRQAELGQADIRYNWYLHSGGEPAELYFFLPLPAPAQDAGPSARYDLDAARTLAPASPVYAHALGDLYMGEVRRRTDKVAEAIALQTVPNAAAIKKTDPKGFEQLVRIFRRAAVEQLAREVRDERLLDLAEEGFRKAVRAAPTVPDYHLSLAECLALKARVEAILDPSGAAWNATRKDADAELERTARFGRNTPYILFGSAQLILAEAADLAGKEGAARQHEAIELLRRAVYAAPIELAWKAYELLTSAGVENEGIFEATPKTVLAYGYLCRFLWSRMAWVDLVTALNQYDELLDHERPDAAQRQVEDAEEPERREDEPSPDSESAPPRFSWASDIAPAIDIQIDIARKRVTVLGLLGRWPEHRDAVARLVRLNRERSRAAIERGAALLERGRYDAAMTEFRNVLLESPTDTDALIGMARVTSVPYFLDQTAESDAPLACLFRIVVNSETISKAHADEMLDLLRRLNPAPGREQVLAEFIESVIVLLAPADIAQPQSRTLAIQRLHKLLTSVDEAATNWPQRHLAWYYLAVGYEKIEEPAKALQMYANVLGLVPNHRRSLAALARLTGDGTDAAASARYAARLTELTPAAPSDTTFGSCIRLLGYSASPGPVPDTITVTYYWEFIEPFPVSYTVTTSFMDTQWRIARSDNRTIAPLGGIYPSDLARCGEVVVEPRTLRLAAPGLAYISVGLSSKTPPRGWEPSLRHYGIADIERLRFTAPEQNIDTQE